MKTIKDCIRCSQTFFGTKSMLVCYLCRDNEQDIEFIEQVHTLELTHSGDSLERINNMIKELDGEI